MTVYAETERIEVPRKLADLAERRTRAFVRAAVVAPDFIRVLACSCYVQGLADAADVLAGKEK